MVTGGETGQPIGPYLIEGRLGQGGMAVVYRARHRYLNRLVALKLMARELSNDPRFRARFEREAELAARLDHPNVVPVYDFGEHEGIPYLAMAYLTGGSLQERLTAIGAKPIPLNLTLDVLQQVAAGLDHAHARRLLHRDLKPANVLIRPADAETPERYLLSDFGIARAVVESQAGESLSMTGAGMLGTPNFMSPEQVRGRPLDARSDVYAFAVMAYRLLAGRRPFEGEAMAVMYAHAHETPPDPRTLNPLTPPGVAQALLRGLAKDPGQRPARAGQLVAEMVAGTQASGASTSRDWAPSEPSRTPTSPSDGTPSAPPYPTPSGAAEATGARLAATDAPLGSPPAPTRPAAPRGRPWWLIGGAALVLPCLVAAGVVGAAMVLTNANSGSGPTASTNPTSEPATSATTSGGDESTPAPVSSEPRTTQFTVQGFMLTHPGDWTVEDDNPAKVLKTGDEGILLINGQAGTLSGDLLLSLFSLGTNSQEVGRDSQKFAGQTWQTRDLRSTLDNGMPLRMRTYTTTRGDKDWFIITLALEADWDRELPVLEQAVQSLQFTR